MHEYFQIMFSYKIRLRSSRRIFADILHCTLALRQNGMDSVEFEKLRSILDSREISLFNTSRGSKDKDGLKYELELYFHIVEYWRDTTALASWVFT